MLLTQVRETGRTITAKWQRVLKMWTGQAGWWANEVGSKQRKLILAPSEPSSKPSRPPGLDYICVFFL